MNDSQGMQLLCVITSIFCFVLRETPENAEIVENIIFHPSVNIIDLLKNGNITLRWIKMYLFGLIENNLS